MLTVCLQAGKEIYIFIKYIYLYKGYGIKVGFRHTVHFKIDILRI